MPAELPAGLMSSCIKKLTCLIGSIGNVELLRQSLITSERALGKPFTQPGAGS